MLPLWRDLYRIVLHPSQVSLVRVRKGRFSKAEAMPVVLEVETGSSPSWREPLSHLETLVAGIASNKADVEIVLSNHFVRYAVIPWSNDVTGIAETLIMTRIHFEEVYGDLAADWELRLSKNGYGEARLASAVDRELLDGLSGLFDGTSLRLASVQPCLMTAFNLCLNKIVDEDCLFILEEPGKVCLAQMRNHQWSQIRVSPVENLEHELGALLNRETLLNGLNASVKKYRFALSWMQENLLPDASSLLLPAAHSHPSIVAKE